MRELSLNIDKASLLDYQIGAVTPEEFYKNSFVNKESGFAINIYNGAISSLFICLKEGYENFKQFKGTVLVYGRKYTFDSDTTDKEIILAFGTPEDSWNDGVEKCLEYRVGGVDVEIVWNVDGDEYLKHISVVQDVAPL